MLAIEDGGILLVCAANVCRSPMAAFTLRRAFAGLPGFEGVVIQSAGVTAGFLSGTCPEVARFRDTDEDWRALAAAHRSRPFEVEHVLRATLVLTASRGIRSSVVTAVPESRSRVFTLREAAWIGEGFVRDPGQRGEDAVLAFARYLDRGRGFRPVPAPARGGLWRKRQEDPLDIRDGHQLRPRAHHSTIRLVDRTARDIAALIGGSRGHRA